MCIGSNYEPVSYTNEIILYFVIGNYIYESMNLFNQNDVNCVFLGFYICNNF
jgi:hypothetical protein